MKCSSVQNCVVELSKLPVLGRRSSDKPFRGIFGILYFDPVYTQPVCTQLGVLLRVCLGLRSRRIQKVK
jgi:hypothetical protein